MVLLCTRTTRAATQRAKARKGLLQMGMVVVKAENWVGGVLGGEVIVVVEVEGAVAVLCLLLVVVVPVLASTSRSESTAR
jgi:hypothetical protein